MITLLGLIAAACTTSAFLPQVLKAWRTRKTGDISMPFTILMAGGLALWLVYGILLSEAPLIAGNSVGLALTLSLFALKMRHG